MSAQNSPPHRVSAQAGSGLAGGGPKAHLSTFLTPLPSAPSCNPGTGRSPDNPNQMTAEPGTPAFAADSEVLGKRQRLPMFLSRDSCVPSLRITDQENLLSP